MFGKDQIAVNGDIKDAAAALNEAGIDAKGFLQPGSQTDRLGFVVSLHTVFDGDIHFWLSFGFRVALAAL